MKVPPAANPGRDVFHPMTPSQYYDQFVRSEHLDGEARLLFAVLEDAIRCLTTVTRGRRNQREVAEAKDWVNTRGDHDLFSFDAICHAFDLNPEQLRRQLNASGQLKMGQRRFRSVGRRTAIRASE